MIKHKKTFAFLLTLALINSFLPTVAYAADASVASYTEFQSAIASAPTDGTLYTIEVTADIECAGALTIPAGTNIKVVSDTSGPRTLTQASATTRHFIVDTGSLALENIVLDGRGANGGVDVNTGNLTMNGGAVITRCFTGDYSVGCGVVLEGSTFTMNGGEISYNQNRTGNAVSGGGIYMTGGSAVMSGGSIHHNASTWGGGIHITNGAVFTMTGGEIHDNEAIKQYGGGVSVNIQGTFIMNGGSIYKNTAADTGCIGGGVFVGQSSYVAGTPTDWCKFIMNSGDIYENEAYFGGGVSAAYNGIVEMNDGTIRENSAVGGGGVSIHAPSGAQPDPTVSFVMKGGEISGNTTTAVGGGLLVYGWQGTPRGSLVVEIGDSTGQATTAPVISGNTAATGGGGICLILGSFATLYSGSVAGNTAENGGGIYTVANSRFNIEGGEIRNNTAIGDGGGIFAENYGSLALHSGSSVTFSDNTASRLCVPPDTLPGTATNWLGTVSSISPNIAGDKNIAAFNNYDINFDGEEMLFYTVTYDANGGSGTVPIESDKLENELFNAASNTLTAPDGKQFVEWNTAADGTGTAYRVGEQITMPAHNLTLYAQWETEDMGSLPKAGDYNGTFGLMMALLLSASGLLCLTRRHYKA